MSRAGRKALNKPEAKGVNTRRKGVNPKPKDEHTGPDHDRRSDDQCNWDGDVRVTGEITVHPPPDLLGEYQASGKENKSHNDKSRIINCLSLLAVVIYAGIAAWQACLTNDIAASARNQASVTRDQMIASQRPWVGPDFKESPIHIGNADEPVRWRVYFKNGGSSPALKVQWHVRLFRPSVGVDYTAVQKEIEMLPMDPKMSFFLLNGDEGPNVSHSQVNGIDVTLGQDNLAGIFRRTMTLALGGRVIYSDEFEGSHETTFCVTYLPPTERAPESWQYCPVNPVAK